MKQTKKLLSAVLATAMAVSLSTTAFAATTVASNQYGTVQVSNVISTKTETLLFTEDSSVSNPDYVYYEETDTDNGVDHFTDHPKLTYTVIPIGSTISATAATAYKSPHLYIAVYYKNAEGRYQRDDTTDIPATSSFVATKEYVGKLLSVEAEVVTIPKPGEGLGGTPAITYETYFLVDGSAPAVTPEIPAETTKPADSTATTAPTAKPAATVKGVAYQTSVDKHLNLSSGESQLLTVTSLNGKKPTVRVAGSSFTVSYIGSKGGDYTYAIQAVGSVGKYGGIYINGDKTAVSTVSIVKPVKATVETTAKAPTYKTAFDKHLNLSKGESQLLTVTSLNGKKPAVRTTGYSLAVSYVGNKGTDYYYSVKATGKVGSYGSIYINGDKTAASTISIPNTVRSDTGAKLTVKPGKVYQFKLTAGQKPTFVAGNPKVFTVSYNGQKGSDYFYLVKAVGKSGQSTGLYINGAKTPATIATVGY